jgi:hypothetical protein
MKYALYFFCALLFQDVKVDADCVPELNRAYMNSVELIAVVAFNDKSFHNGRVSGAVMEVFKGSEYKRINIHQSDTLFNFNEPGEYLIYAKVWGDDDYYISKCSRTKELAGSIEDLEFLAENIPCIDRRLIHNGACLRAGGRICGCDGNEYPDPCEARRQGVARFTVGPCP